MAKVRQDAWSHEDDLLLAETVLRHVRDGSTQLNAFDEVGDVLNRTSAACGFRWNAEVRKKYEHAMDLAKRQRKEKKRSLAKVKRQRIVESPTIVDSQTEHPKIKVNEAPISLEAIIHFLQNMKKETLHKIKSQDHMDKLQSENKRLHEEITQLKRKLTETEKQLNTIQNDYQTFVEIMERARKMTVLDGLNPMKSPMFKMDKNGNLEQVVPNAQS